jgi:hypothetical protein
MTLLDLTEAPREPVHRVLWLSELSNLLAEELHLAYRKAYFEARQQGTFEVAVEVGPFSRTVALAMTREHNEATGRQLRWEANPRRLAQNDLDKLAKRVRKDMNVPTDGGRANKRARPTMSLVR